LADHHPLFGLQTDPAGDSGYAPDHPPRKGFFTDTSICIGCKACEVACKQWNGVPDDGFDLLGMSYDNTGQLGDSTWRHVAFIEHPGGMPPGTPPAGGSVGLSGGVGRVPEGSAFGPSSSAERGSAVDLGMPGVGPPGRESGVEGREQFSWLMASDVCKHCTHAGCLDVCPTGALFRTEFGTVVVQPDICNGCGYCVSGCPYGVIQRREGDGRAWKCTLCYDRLKDGEEPACAHACPTKSIQFGDLDELRERAAARVDQLHEQGVTEARLYGEDPTDGVGGNGAFFLLLDEPEVYGFPPDPVVPTRDLPRMWKYAGLAAGALAAVAVAVFGGQG
jgi:formate dehydrogenase iron-sulfur subunit